MANESPELIRARLPTAEPLHFETGMVAFYYFFAAFVNLKAGMNLLRFASFAALILFFSIVPMAPFAHAEVACTSESSDIKNSCQASDRYIKESRQAYTDAKSALDDRKDIVGIQNARNKIKDAITRLLEDGGADSPVQASKKCTKAVDRCKISCTKRDEVCKSEGEDKKREDEIKRFEALDKELGKTEGDGTAGGKGDGKGEAKGDKAKKDDKGGGGGGMPEMPKPPEDKKDENADKSCGGSTPDPSCPPKDDVCFKDPNSVACLCQAGLGTAEVCKRAEAKSERDKGATDGQPVDSGGKSATYSTEGIGADPAKARARANAAGFGGGGGAKRSGLGGVSSGSGSGNAGAGDLSASQRYSESSSSGSGGGGFSSGGGGSRMHSSSNTPKPYEKMLARGVAIAQRRLAGVGGEIGGSHGNLFESISRAYRAKASTLRK